MATGILYLDVDDEITSAATRIRAAEGSRVAVVVPYGSRVATSRINFRLLARDATRHQKRLSIVAGDAATRALAASAGLPIFATVGEYESAIEAEAGSGTSDAGAGASTAATAAGAAAAGIARAADDADPVEGDVGDATAGAGSRDADLAALTVAAAAPATRSQVPPAGAGPADSTATLQPGPPGEQAGSSATRVRAVAPSRQIAIGRTPVAIGLAVIALAVIVGAVGAFLILPSASVVVTPAETSIGPVALNITASTEIDTPDMAAGVVPAETLEVDVQADDTFAATGKRVEEEDATGVVRFDNLDPTGSNTIAKGAVVSTSSGVRFRTDAKVTVPAAKLVGLSIVPSRATVGVTAVDGGPEGNVEANTILTIPRGEEPLFLKVTNPDPTDGGSRKEFPRVTQADVDGARVALDEKLAAAFRERLAEPDLVSADLTVFPETGVLGETGLTVDPDTLVGQEVASFDLGATATGTVTSVDAAPVREIAEARLLGSVKPGHQLVEGSSEISEAPAIVDGDTITYPVVATARQIAILDPAVLKASILGQPLEEANRILGVYGDVELEVWPDWVGTIPTIDSRVEVVVLGPVVPGAAGATPSPSASP